MRRGLIALISIAALAFGAALFVLGDRPTPENSIQAESQQAPSSASKRPKPAPVRENPSALPERPAKPPGLRLGNTRGPSARANAQAIIDDALAELRRLDSTHQTEARDVYMRGHSAAERVEDELDKDDEPGLAKLRADEEAMKAELRRIYGVREDASRP